MLSKPAFLALLLALAAPLSAADKVVAVLSSASGVYLEAFNAFEKQYGAEVQAFDLSAGNPEIPDGTRVIVAFGTKAASRAYPEGANLIYVLSPGYFAESPKNGSARVKICMMPEPKSMLAKIKELHPAAKKMQIFWRSPGYQRLHDEYEKAGASLGIAVYSFKVAADEHIPVLLRSSVGNADAFWLPPDPLLVSKTTLGIFRQFARANKVPIYVSTEGLAKKGACASIGPSFAQIGRAAAGTAKDLLAGKEVPEITHSDDFRTTLNVSEALNCGLIFSAAAIEQADEHYH